MPSISVEQRLKKDATTVENTIDQWLPEDSGNIPQMMRYTLLAKSKRLRASLAYTVAALVSQDQGMAHRIAVALEAVHAFSLIHDDLPCMDDDDTRRYQPSSHKVYGEANALLAADALQAYAFEVLTDPCLAVSQIPDHQLAGVILELSRAIGYQGMIRGQVCDMELESLTSVSLEVLSTMHADKTGAMFQASITMACLAYGLDRAVSSSLLTFTQHFGKAFQIRDDILDETQGSLGRPAGSDEKNGKATFVSILGIDAARFALDKELQLALKAIKSIDREKYNDSAIDYLSGLSKLLYEGV